MTKWQIDIIVQRREKSRESIRDVYYTHEMKENKKNKIKKYNHISDRSVSVTRGEARSIVRVEVLTWTSKLRLSA